jgi:hypothetical protein
MSTSENVSSLADGEPDTERPRAPLLLEAPSPSATEDDGSIQKLVPGSNTTLKFDSLGPLVVNSDGVRSHSQTQHLGAVRLIQLLSGVCDLRLFRG